MGRNDPFAGIRLSEQASPKLDQRLFESESHPPPAPKIVRMQPQPEIVEAPAVVPEKHETVIVAPSVRFDLSDLPVFKASYLFTQEELETLEDLKLELRREYNSKVTKNDLIRCALHMLAEDHAVKKGQSYVSRKMKQRWAKTAIDARPNRSTR